MSDNQKGMTECHRRWLSSPEYQKPHTAKYVRMSYLLRDYRNKEKTNHE